VDLHQPLDADTVATIRQALLDYKVIFLPETSSPSRTQAVRHLFRRDHLRPPVIPGIDEHREVFEIDYTQAKRIVTEQKTEYGTTEKWLTDVTFVETPPLGLILNAIVIPPPAGTRCGPTPTPPTRACRHLCSALLMG
jgi:alpha-ketoglutarate-dependent taurine dioxygenase